MKDAYSRALEEFERLVCKRIVIKNSKEWNEKAIHKEVEETLELGEVESCLASPGVFKVIFKGGRTLCISVNNGELKYS